MMAPLLLVLAFDVFVKELLAELWVGFRIEG